MTPRRLRHRPERWLGLLWLALMPAVGAAAEHVWLIGGGNNVRSSEAQIEQNVIWATRTLQSLPGQRRLHLYFTDGRDPGYDIKEILPGHDSTLEPVSRLYEFGRRQRVILRNHRVPGVLGGTARDQLLPKLTQEFRALRPGDQVIVVFNGHGTPAKRGLAQHRLWLWNDTWLDVSDVEKLLSEIPEGVTTRFVLTQCYSGGFARVVHPRAANTLELTRGERCGFMASAADQPAEGCSASIDVGRYRDYSTYFFAALSGRARDGGPLLSAPDLDRDGRVSPYEAHLYAMAAANSADVPRATSEDFLERWQQGVVRWRGTGHESVQAGNLYGVLAIDLARRAGLDARQDSFEQQWLEQRIAETQRIRQFRRELKRLERSIRELQAEIMKDIEAKYPRLRAQVMQMGFTPPPAVREAIARIRQHPRYPALVEAQDRENAQELQLLDHERRLARLDRIERLRRLSLWLHRFEATASDEDKSAYHRLLACEKKPLGGQRP